MSLSIVGAPTTAIASSIALPTHAVGDLLLICTRGTSIPTIPTASGTVPAWVAISSTQLTVALGLYSFVATATNHTSGTWTNATNMIALVIRTDKYADGYRYLVSNVAVGNASNTQTIVYPALTVFRLDGSSIGLRLGTRATAVAAVANPPSGWTALASSGSPAIFAAHSLLGFSSHPTADSVATAGTNATYRAITHEVSETIPRKGVTVT